MKQPSALEQSVQARLVRHAKEQGVDPNLILTRYAAERMLYRLSRSAHAQRFVLKGGMLLAVWMGDLVRPTRDVDLLGFGDLSDQELVAVFSDVAGIEVEPDGVSFDRSSIAVAPIREEDIYGGKRVTLRGHLGPARLKVQIDIGMGDAVYPDPDWLEYPSLLDLPHPRLRAYHSGELNRRETARHGDAWIEEQPHARFLRHPPVGSTPLLRWKRACAGHPDDI